MGRSWCAGQRPRARPGALPTGRRPDRRRLRHLRAELAVSVGATFSAAAGLAVGNVVGSNISNILLVLDLAALVLPVAVRSQLLRIDVPVMITFSVLALVLALNGLVGRLEGLLLLALLMLYLSWSVKNRPACSDP